jgi:hypothetical protein
LHRCFPIALHADRSSPASPSRSERPSARVAARGKWIPLLT